MIKACSRSLLSSFVIAVLIGLVAGCSSTPEGSGNGTDTPHEDEAVIRLWKRKCIECHGLYAPSSYSDSEWVLIMDDMASEAHLTEDEKAAILALMQKNNG